MSRRRPFIKDPDAILDYQVNWKAWLADDDTIVASSWAPQVGITVQSSSHTDTTATVWLSGGTLGVTYDVVNHITTDQGRVNDQTISILISSR